MASLEALEQRVQELKVLQAELNTARPDAKLYSRRVGSSNIFFLEKDRDQLKKDTQEQHDGICKQVNELKAKDGT